MDSIIDWLEAVEAELDSLQQISSTVDNLENQLSQLKVRWIVTKMMMLSFMFNRLIVN